MQVAWVLLLLHLEWRNVDDVMCHGSSSPAFLLVRCAPNDCIRILLSLTCWPGRERAQLTWICCASASIHHQFPIRRGRRQQKATLLLRAVLVLLVLAVSSRRSICREMARCSRSPMPLGLEWHHHRSLGADPILLLIPRTGKGDVAVAVGKTIGYSLVLLFCRL